MLCIQGDFWVMGSSKEVWWSHMNWPKDLGGSSRIYDLLLIGKQRSVTKWRKALSRVRMVISHNHLRKSYNCLLHGSQYQWPTKNRTEENFWSSLILPLFPWERDRFPLYAGEYTIQSWKCWDFSVHSGPLAVAVTLLRYIVSMFMTRKWTLDYFSSRRRTISRLMYWTSMKSSLVKVN